MDKKLTRRQAFATLKGAALGSLLIGLDQLSESGASNSKQTPPIPSLVYASQHRPIDSINLLDFGALGDGISNDAIALDKALRIVKERGGGKIWIPKGKYLINPAELPGKPSSLFSQLSNLEIIGESASATNLIIPRTYSRQDQRLFFHGKNQLFFNWTIAGLTFDCEGEKLPEWQECFRDKLLKIAVQGFAFRNCVVLNEPGRGVFTVLGDDQTYEDCYFSGIGCRATDSSVIHPGNIYKPVNNVRIRRCIAVNGRPSEGRFNRTTFYDAQASDVEITDCLVQGGKKAAIMAIASQASRNIAISGCTFDVHHQCINIYPSRNTGTYSKMAGIHISNCRLAAHTPISVSAPPGLYIQEFSVENSVLSRKSMIRGAWIDAERVQGLTIKNALLCSAMHTCRSISHLYKERVGRLLI